LSENEIYGFENFAKEIFKNFQRRLQGKDQIRGGLEVCGMPPADFVNFLQISECYSDDKFEKQYAPSGQTAEYLFSYFTCYPGQIPDQA